MTPLAQLLDAVRAGNATGDDATLRAAWDAETRPESLLDVLTTILDRDDSTANRVRYGRACNATGYIGCSCACLGGGYVECPACCTAIRVTVVCPAWSELTRAA